MKGLRSPLLVAWMLALGLAACGQPDALSPPTVAPQFGTARDDVATVVTTDARRGRIYVAGTFGSDLFFRRYDRDGSFVWGRRIHLSGYETQANDAATDSSGNLYFGWNASKDSATYRGVVTKDHPNGTRLFERTLKGARVDGLTTDGSGNLYLIGQRVNDADEAPFVRRYSPSGKLLWHRSLAVAGDENDDPPLRRVSDLALAANGSLYLVGESFDKTRGYLLEVSSRSGVVLRSTLFWSQGVKVAVSGDLIYVLSAYEDIYDGGFDYMIHRFRPDLTWVWSRYDPAPDPEEGRDDEDSYGLSTDAQGNAYVAATYTGWRQLDENTSEEDPDYVVRKYTPTGKLVLNRRSAVTGTNTRARDIAVLSAGELYLVGTTDYRIGGVSKGGMDAFVARLDSRARLVWVR